MILRPANTLFGPGSAPNARRYGPRTPVQNERTWSPLDVGRVLLSIDPSISNCGWAILRQEKPHPLRIDSGVFHPVASDRRDRFDCLSDLIRQCVRKSEESGVKITDAIIEEPHPGGARDLRSVAHLMVYSRAIGICESTCRRAGLRTQKATVTEWKGNSKKAQALRTAGWIFAPYKTSNDNEADALCLGAWLCSRTNYNERSQAGADNTDLASKHTNLIGGPHA